MASDDELAGLLGLAVHEDGGIGAEEILILALSGERVQKRQLLISGIVSVVKVLAATYVIHLLIGLI